MDTIYYKISENKTAFSIKTSFMGLSRANPYEYTMITWYIKDDDSIIPVLKNYITFESKGEWDTKCAGTFNTKNNELIVSKNQTNGYFDIQVKQSISNSTAYEREDGGCDEKEEKHTNTLTLKFINGKYQ